MLFVAARTPDNTRVISPLVPAAGGDALAAERLTLLAANASSTVRLRITRLFVPAEMVVSDEPYHPPPDYDGGGRPNGSLSLGVAARCLTLLGPSALDRELVARRDQLDQAGHQTMAEARAAAVELAQRASAALVVHSGSTSLFPRQHAQRLAREAVFLAVFGTRRPSRRISCASSAPRDKNAVHANSALHSCQTKIAGELKHARHRFPGVEAIPLARRQHRSSY